MTLPAPLILSLSKDMPAHRAFPNVTYSQLRAELQREADYRRRTYPQMIAKGNMTQAEADWQQAIIAAIAQDLEAVIARADHGTRLHPFTWHEKRAALTRELAQRARLYPGWIAKGNMTAEAGHHQRDCLAAMLAIYGEGWGWRAANGVPPGFGEVDPTPQQIASQAEWHETSIALAAQSGQQETLAL